VCWRCYHRSFTNEDLNEARWLQRRRGLAEAIRGAADRAGDRRTQRLRNRAFLIETATSEDEVLSLVRQVRALGVRLEVRR
jgi:hypothetical protein